MHGSGGQSEADPNLTPLLDVVLQLIMFFMITVNFVRELTLEVRLPEAESLVPKNKDDDERELSARKIDKWIYINVDKNGKIMGEKFFKTNAQTRVNIQVFLKAAHK